MKHSVTGGRCAANLGAVKPHVHRYTPGAATIRAVRSAVLLTAGGAEDERVIATGFDLLPRWASDSRHFSFGRPDGIWLLDVDAADPPTRLSEGSGATPAHTWPDLHLER